jgi:hypothetical protein
VMLPYDCASYLKMYCDLCEGHMFEPGISKIMSQ